MISASKSNLNINNFKILRPKIMENLTNLHKKFGESPPWPLSFFCSGKNITLFENKTLIQDELPYQMYAMH